jgi:hypothetical protein
MRVRVFFDASALMSSEAKMPAAQIHGIEMFLHDQPI